MRTKQEETLACGLYIKSRLQKLELEIEVADVLMAVSYTHLDVYKRQLRKRSPLRL